MYVSLFVLHGRVFFMKLNFEKEYWNLTSDIDDTSRSLSNTHPQKQATKICSQFFFFLRKTNKNFMKQRELCVTEDHTHQTGLVQGHAYRTLSTASLLFEERKISDQG